MTTPYRGRHNEPAHPILNGSGARTTARSASFSRAARRPLASFAAVCAVVGVTAASYASAAKPHTSAVSYKASPEAVAQAAELVATRSDTNLALAEARRSGVQRASAVMQQNKTAAEALAVARTEAAAAQVRARVAAAAQVRARAAELSRERAAELSRERAVASARVSRDSVRKSLTSSAQSDPKAAARALAADRGWGSGQFDCLSSLWTKESGWRWDAKNSSSGAYGIPQSLPGSKMASVASDWDTNPITQIKWGLSYISSTYGTPCSAWAHSQSTNWY